MLHRVRIDFSSLRIPVPVMKCILPILLLSALLAAGPLRQSYTDSDPQTGWLGRVRIEGALRLEIRIRLSRHCGASLWLDRPAREARHSFFFEVALERKTEWSGRA